MNPDTAWRDMGNQRCLYLHFNGHFSAENAQQAIRAIAALTEKTEGKITMVWECTAMTSYETPAREAWQAFIKELKPKLERIHLVSKNIVIRTGAMVVGIFAGIRITTWATLDEFSGPAAS